MSEEKTVEVRLTVCRAGAETSHVSGDVIRVSASEAKSLLEAGQAEAVAKRGAQRAEKRIDGGRETR